MHSRRVGFWPSLVLALVVVATACSSSEPDITADEPPGPPPTTTTTSTQTSTSTSTPTQTSIGLETVATLPGAIAMGTRPGSSDLYVAQRQGAVRRIAVEGSGAAATHSLTPDDVVTIAVSTNGERGLLGLAFSPDGDHLYLSYTDGDGASVIDEFTMSGTVADRDSRRQVIKVDQPFSNHNGGDVHFGPDGYLYWGLGDGGQAGDPFGHGQNRDTLLGSILRIDPGTGDPYAVPPDNPYVEGGGRAEIWLHGVRNPWRFSFDRSTGDLWIGDVGQNRIEEIDKLDAPDSGRGANLGWSLREGSDEFDGAAPPDHVPPVFEYAQNPGCSVTGGYVYRGQSIPDLVGTYVYGDFCDGSISGLEASSATPTELALSIGPSVLGSFGEGADGELYVLDLSGPVQRLVLG